MPLFGESLMFETLDASGEVDCPYKLEIPVFGESLMFDTLWMPQAKDKRGGCTAALQLPSECCLGSRLPHAR